jgi:hypothetical protein
MSRKLLIILAFALGIFMASGAMAVDYGDLSFNHLVVPNTAGTILNPEGKGDALICPYFDVRVVNGQTQDTYFAIINENMDATPDQGVAAKLRFREWDKSEEVFDIDIWLSDNDVWVGAITRDSANGLGKITSPDYVIIDDSADYFVISKTTQVASGFDFFTDFVPGGVDNPSVLPPAGFTSADLTNMGYFEIIGEERTYTVPDPATLLTPPVHVTRFNGSPVAVRDCPNSLSAYVYIIRVANGVSLGYNCDAIANFNRTKWLTLYAGPGAPTPDLSQCQDGLDQLEFELSKAKVYQGYDISDAIAGQFSLVVTFPTKHFHFHKPVANVRLDYTSCLVAPIPGVEFCAAPAPPFTGSTANSGELVNVKIYDRDETPCSPELGFWSPRTTPTISLPWEVNVISLYPSSAPSVPLQGIRDNVDFTACGFQNGWFWIDLYDSVHFASRATAFGHLGLDFSQYNGLPTSSRALQEFSNGAIAGYYGDAFPAFYQLNWTEIP